MAIENRAGLIVNLILLTADTYSNVVCIGQAPARFHLLCGEANRRHNITLGVFDRINLPGKGRNDGPIDNYMGNYLRIDRYGIFHLWQKAAGLYTNSKRYRIDDHSLLCRQYLYFDTYRAGPDRTALLFKGMTQNFTTRGLRRLYQRPGRGIHHVNESLPPRRPQPVFGCGLCVY